MFNLESATWLQVEATTKCNAWCPGCSRNNGGYGLADGFAIEDLNSQRFEEVVKQLPNLEVIDFCGTRGDAIAAGNIEELTAIAKRYAKKIMVRTNGSLRDVKWWVDYASLLQGVEHEVWFCIDGLADTHHIYRQATDWNKIITNAQTFIDAGGTAVWQFIPWAHNEHQIPDCIRLSQRMGFKSFKFIDRVRKDFDARDYRTGNPVNIQPWSRDGKVNPLVQVKSRVELSNCMHLSQPSIYINADGSINVCCQFNLTNAVNSADQLMDIPDMFDKQEWRKTCLHYCGTP